MGINTLTGKATMENIPSGKDRSMFACTKYQFFLDAPFEIANHCCRVMKKSPAKAYTKKTGRHPITAQMASESRLRTQIWLKQGCNAFNAKKPISNPMSFWLEQDVLTYIKSHDIKIASVYGDVVVDYETMGVIDGQMSLSNLPEEFGVFDMERPILKTTGCARTGCMFCGFGCHLEKPGEGRFERMKVTHPKMYDYIMRPWEYETEIIDPETLEQVKVTMRGLNYKEVIDWINEHGNMNIRY